MQKARIGGSFLSRFLPERLSFASWMPTLANHFSASLKALTVCAAEFFTIGRRAATDGIATFLGVAHKVSFVVVDCLEEVQ
jgi:hypothetical protein